MKGVEEGDDKQNLPGEKRKRKKERKKSFQETGRKSLDRIGREGEARRERGGREGRSWEFSRKEGPQETFVSPKPPKRV